MALSHQHELHRRRLGRNIGLGGVLFAFVAIIFALSIVKVTYQGDSSAASHGGAHSAPVAAPAAAPTPAEAATSAPTSVEAPSAAPAAGAGQ